VDFQFSDPDTLHLILDSENGGFTTELTLKLTKETALQQHLTELSESQKEQETTVIMFC